MFTEYPDMVSVEQAQEMLTIGKKKIYALIKDESLDAIKGKGFKITKLSIIASVLG